ncbi:RNA-binding domain-containing protein [Halomonas halodenitrificans]|uniref:RNA-binding domain-containing protein n=1 Tax=Halomonas halodenitrificans TaxID=28252 RepID=UPI00048248A6|nr:ATP-binding protein [Halomonas halodenitrificans]
MRSRRDIEALLDELEHCIADDLEDQDLDFKQWDTKSRDKAVKKVVEMAICMANGGGGSVVFGVADRISGREQAVLGVPPEVDINILKRAVYDQTDPHITPVFEELHVPEGTGRVLIMQVYSGMPPHTDTKGGGTVRIGKDCQPLTGTQRRKIGVETGDTDYTAETLGPVDDALFSPVALEALRNLAQRERAPDELLRRSDRELLDSLGLIRKGQVTRAAILLAGTEEALREHVPGHLWTFLQMRSDTDYGIREDRVSALPLSVQRIEELLVPFNPITTVQQGMFHFEYRTWPEVAVREALMNAFCHGDLRLAGPVMIKLYPQRLEVSNNGGFIAGISEHNILHHQPAARNPLLVDALVKLRLVNRSNLGVSRMFEAMLMEGKEPPVIREIGDSVAVIFHKREINAAFRQFVAEESESGRSLGVDQLLLLQYFLQHPEVDTATAAGLCQRTEPETRELLAGMEQLEYVEHGGSGRGTYWSLHPALYTHLMADGKADKRRRIDWDAAKTRVLSILIERARRGEPGLSNKEIRQITRFDRNHAYRLMRELREENPQIQPPGKGKHARYEYRNT